MFLANENYPRPSILLLREKGYTVKSIQEDNPGVSDQIVINIAIEQELIILTFDSDYGELIFKYSKENPPSVVYFRDKSDNPNFASITLLKILESSTMKLFGKFTVIEPNNIRQRSYTKA